MVPINVDVVATPKSYAHLPPQTLLVTSVFMTVQGEGQFAGRKAVFIRLAGCNYGPKQTHCQFCDTAFSLAHGRPMSFDYLLTRVADLWRGSLSDTLLVITGGEPLLQPALAEFVVAAIAHGVGRIQLETNGVFVRQYLEGLHQHRSKVYFRQLERVSYCISPKPASAKGYIADQVSRDWYSAESADVGVRAANTIVKFVVSADPGSPHFIVPKTSAPFDIYLSPMAVYKKPYVGEVSSAWDHDLIDAQATGANYAHAAALCVKHNYRLSIQQHIFCAVP